MFKHKLTLQKYSKILKIHNRSRQLKTITLEYILRKFKYRSLEPIKSVQNATQADGSISSQCLVTWSPIEMNINCCSAKQKLFSVKVYNVS